MILVSVQQPGDLQPARTFVAALGNRFALYVLFGSHDLQARFGKCACECGTDSAACLLNPQNFELLVSFSGLLDSRCAANLQLLACFNQLGIETVEIQHALFQPGMEGGPAPRRAGLSLGYAARTLISWGGEGGVGYLGSALPVQAPPASHGEFILVTQGGAEPKDQYQFAIAALKLAASRPQLTFVWRCEDAYVDESKAAAMVADYGLPNVCMERATPVADLVAGCRAGITTCSTALVEYQLHGKPALVHTGGQRGQPLPHLRAASFESAADLGERFDELLAHPEAHRVDAAVLPLAPERLEQRLREVLVKTRLRPDFLPIALSFLPGLRSALPDARTDFEHLVGHLTHILQRVAVLQRSTLAYKAKKLAARVLSRETP